jgi:hypothetical protein
MECVLPKGAFSRHAQKTLLVVAALLVVVVVALSSLRIPVPPIPRVAAVR